MAIAFVAPGFRSVSRQDISDANARLARATDKISELQDQLDRLLLITESMWFVLKDKLQLDDAVLMDMMKHVDMKDGKLDGKATTKPETCPNCNHTISLRTGRCLYCGTQAKRAGPF